MITKNECKEIFNRCVNNHNIMKTIFFEEKSIEENFDEEIYRQKLLDSVIDGTLIDRVIFNVKNYYTEREVCIMLETLPQIFKIWIKNYTYNFPIGIEHCDKLYYNKKEINRWFKVNNMKKK